MPSKTQKIIHPDFDVSLLEANLMLSVEDRIKMHDEALTVALEFKKAGELFYREQKKTLARPSSEHGDR